MNEPKRTALRALCSVALVLGLMSLLAETRSTGEALETFKMMLSSNVISAVGAGVIVLALVGFGLLHFWERKGTTKHP